MVGGGKSARGLILSTPPPSPRSILRFESLSLSIPVTLTLQLQPHSLLLILPNPSLSIRCLKINLFNWKYHASFLPSVNEVLLIHTAQSQCYE